MSKYLFITTAVLGLVLIPVLAQTAAQKAKPAAASTKPMDSKKPKHAESTTRATTRATKKPAETTPAERSAEKKPGELSNPDQALMAHAEKASSKLTDLQSTKLLELLNTGDDNALQQIPGVGEVRANAIKKARPLTSLAALVLVEGIGEVTFDEILTWTKDGMKIDGSTEKPIAKRSDTPAPKRKDAPKKAAKQTAPAKPAEKHAATKKPQT